jgi:adenylate kinase family enzyme
MALRVAILGNSGSGKSTVAKWLAAHASAAMLDLDTVAWEPDQVVVLRSSEAAGADVRAFCGANKQWVVEGCYASLVGVALEFEPLLLFLNPGEAQCLVHCRARPWEPHKYASKQEQDERLAFLLKWVSEYYTRDGAMSLLGHRECFECYAGPKQEITAPPKLESFSDDVQFWLGEA